MAHPAAPGPVADPVGVRTTAHLTRLGCPPDFVKAAAAKAPEWAGLPAVCYADDAKSYPVHDKTAAAVSAAIYHAARDRDPTVGARIKRACEVYGVAAIWEGLAVKAASLTTPEPPYALPAKKKYPLGTPVQVKAAAAYLAEYGDSFAADERKTYATNLLAADTSLLGPYEKSAVEHAAGLGRPACDPVRVFAPRKVAADSPTARKQLDELEKTLKAGGDPYAVADGVRALDAKYGWAFGDPGPALTGLTPTLAGRALAAFVIAPDGSWYRKADLEHVPAEKLAEAYGLGPIVSREKRASLLTEYPDTYPAFLAEYGVRPVHVPPAGRTVYDWEALAAE